VRPGPTSGGPARTNPEPVPSGSVPALVLDNRRAPCAVGLIRAAREVAPLPSGTELQIWSTDRFAPTEISLWAVRDGYVLQSHTPRGSWPRRHHVFVVVKPG
jgi:TusA-related sulfurtransferase